MGLNTGNFTGAGGGGNSEPLPVGGHVARLVQIVDKGIQERNPYQGQTKPPVQQIVFTYELPYQRTEVDGESKPRWISISRNAVGGQKAALTKDLIVLNPQGGEVDLGSLVGTPVIVNIEQKTNASGQPIEGTKISSIGHVPQGMDVPPLENNPRVFDFERPDPEVYKLLPEWLQGDIMNANNYPGSQVQAMVASLQAGGQGQAAPQQAPAAQAPQAMAAPAPQPQVAQMAPQAAPQAVGPQVNPPQAGMQPAPQPMNQAQSPALGSQEGPAPQQNQPQANAHMAAPGHQAPVQPAQGEGMVLPPPPTPGY